MLKRNANFSVTNKLCKTRGANTCLIERIVEKASKVTRETISSKRTTIKSQRRGLLAHCGKMRKRNHNRLMRGKFHFQRHTLKEICRQLTDSKDEVICNLACWKNSNEHGPYLTVEVSPQFVAYERRLSNSDLFDDMFNEEDEQ
jgi:hypothetical protein